MKCILVITLLLADYFLPSVHSFNYTSEINLNDKINTLLLVLPSGIQGFSIRNNSELSSVIDKSETSQSVQGINEDVDASQGLAHIQNLTDINQEISKYENGIGLVAETSYNPTNEVSEPGVMKQPTVSEDAVEEIVGIQNNPESQSIQSENNVPIQQISETQSTGEVTTNGVTAPIIPEGDMIYVSGGLVDDVTSAELTNEANENLTERYETENNSDPLAQELQAYKSEEIQEDSKESVLDGSDRNKNNKEPQIKEGSQEESIQENIGNDSSDIQRENITQNNSEERIQGDKISNAKEYKIPQKDYNELLSIVLSGNDSPRRQSQESNDNYKINKNYQWSSKYGEEKLKQLFSKLNKPNINKKSNENEDQPETRTQERSIEEKYENNNKNNNNEGDKIGKITDVNNYHVGGGENSGNIYYSLNYRNNIMERFEELASKFNRHDRIRRNIEYDERQVNRDDEFWTALLLAMN